MILDTLSHAGRYEAGSPRFEKAFAFLRTITGAEATGRHEIDGDDVYALVQKYPNKPLETAQFEAHRIYADVQYVHSGRESILWAPLAAMREVNSPYNEAKDGAHFKLVPDYTALHLSAGQMAILYPQDAHAPGILWDQPTNVFKVVVKVRLTPAGSAR